VKTAAFLLAFLLLLSVRALAAGAAIDADPLAVGIAAHAFDHLGDIADQAPAAAAAASGASIIYAAGVGSLGYQGLPTTEQLNRACAASAAYVRDAKARGIRLAIGYVCVTSIVKLDEFDRHWTPQFRAQFATPPGEWLQQDRDGKPLASWYGGDYRPACMNNPDWRAYEKSIVKLQLDAGHDGIFFDNPTVHPQGCYCPHCMKKFARFLGDAAAGDANVSLAALRQLALARPKDFMRFRCSIAADFLTEMRAYARTINLNARITCNNSLNAPDAFYAQCRTYAYDMHAMSAAEDLVVVEDMTSQPRVRADGMVVEYGPVYEMLRAISHGKPIVACTLAEGDYHTPPNLARLAMAEASAHGASYMSWPTWPADVRQRMIDAIRPEADFLRQHAELLNGTKSPADVLLFLPFRRWIDTADCATLKVAQALGHANMQFQVVCEDDLPASLAAANAPGALVVESASVLNGAERAAVEKYKAGGGAIILTDHERWLDELPGSRVVEVVKGPPTLRAVVRNKPGKTIVHLLNLNVARLSSFEDRVTPASDVRLRIRCRGLRPRSVTALTCDPDATRGAVPFIVTSDASGVVVETTVSKIALSTILCIE